MTMLKSSREESLGDILEAAMSTKAYKDNWALYNAVKDKPSNDTPVFILERGALYGPYDIVEGAVRKHPSGVVFYISNDRVKPEPANMTEWQEAAWHGHKIDAIKSLRTKSRKACTELNIDPDLYALGLGDAKRAVEDWIAKHC